jgi:hypothetical protein
MGDVLLRVWILRVSQLEVKDITSIHRLTNLSGVRDATLSRSQLAMVYHDSSIGPVPHE